MSDADSRRAGAHAGIADPTGTLCTLALEPEGYPYGSFVTVAFDNGDPIFLISALAEHTKNLERDPRASLLVAEGGADDPLANGRVTIIGRCTRVEGDGGSARAAFLAVHPNAGYYADFRDFSFWKLGAASIRYIGGYGRMSWVEQAEWQAAEPDRRRRPQIVSPDAVTPRRWCSTAAFRRRPTSRPPP